MPRLPRLLGTLPPTEQREILSFCTEIELASGQSLFGVGDEFSAIFFPLTAVISVTTELSDGRLVESTSIGREGIAGLSALLGARRSQQYVVTQVPGRALRTSADDARRLANERCPAFRERIGLLADCTMTSMGQSAACLALHPVVERCARWLLMDADRAGSDRFHLTQEFLAAMLGVHRPSVTVAARTLQDAGLIDYHRGEIRIVDRAGLEAASCECYAVIRDMFEEFLGVLE